MEEGDPSAAEQLLPLRTTNRANLLQQGFETGFGVFIDDAYTLVKEREKSSNRN